MKKPTDKWMHNCERPSVHSPPPHTEGGCVRHWREASREIRGDALNALMQSNCFQISHWWTVSFQAFNHLPTHPRTHTHAAAAPVTCSKSGHRYDALCSTPDLWPVILKCRCIMSRRGGQDGGQEVMAGRKRGGLCKGRLIYTQIN